MYFGMCLTCFESLNFKLTSSTPTWYSAARPLDTEKENSFVLSSARIGFGGDNHCFFAQNGMERDKISLC